MTSIRFSPQIDNIWKRNPSRVLLMNILGGLIILTVLGSLFYPVYQAGRPEEKNRYLKQQKNMPHQWPEFWADPEKYFAAYSYIPVLVAGTVLAAGMLLVVKDLRQIPKYLELTGEGIKIGRWLAAEEYIPYADIAQVYERPFYGYSSASVCLRTLNRGKICILKYAYPNWEDLYGQLREKTVVQRFSERLSNQH